MRITYNTLVGLCEPFRSIDSRVSGRLRANYYELIKYDSIKSLKNFSIYRSRFYWNKVLEYWIAYPSIKGKYWNLIMYIIKLGIFFEYLHLHASSK